MIENRSTVLIMLSYGSLTLRYTLVTFNDYGPDIKKNVEVVLDTSDIKVSR